MSLKLTKIDADDSTRAKAVSLRSRGFRRMVALVRPHRRIIAVGMIAAVFMALLHSASITGMLPVLKLLFSQEGLHGWIDRMTAEHRLDAGLLIDQPYGSEQEELRLRKVGSKSDLAAKGGRPHDMIVAVAGAEASPAAMVQHIAEAPSDTISLTIRTGGPDGKSRTIEACPLQPTDFKLAFAQRLSSMLPAGNTPSDRIKTMAVLLVIVLIAVLLTNIFRYAAQYYVSYGVLRSLMDLRRELYAKVLRLPMSFFTRDTSQIVSPFVQDMQEIQRGLVALFGKLFREPLKAIFLLAVALYTDWQITVVLLLVAPTAAFVFMSVGRRVRKANRRLLAGYGTMIGALETTLSAITVVKAQGTEGYEQKRLWAIDRDMFGDQLRIVRLEAILTPLLEVLGAIAVSAVALWLGSRVTSGELDPGTFVFLLITLGMLLDPVRKVADVYNRVMRAAAGAERIFHLLDLPIETDRSERTVELAGFERAVEFCGVTFTYPEAEMPALNGLNLTIDKGETVAIVGPNGSGKTTIMRLVLAFYTPDSGQVLIDGHDLSTVKLRSLRRQISMVTQDPVVFAISMADNIAYGSNSDGLAGASAAGARIPSRTPGTEPDSAIQDAARRAYADEFIRELPQGYETLAGERGTTLSGGQRQRLCIARAVLRNAPIFIFDEATSQIDSESEQKIQNSLAALAQGRTTIIVAHRLSTIRFASRIVVMDRGKVLDTGSHGELFERCPLYRALCETQLAG